MPVRSVGQVIAEELDITVDSIGTMTGLGDPTPAAAPPAPRDY